MARKRKHPIAFMSYVRFEDEHADGRLTEFRERLSAEVRVQTGEEFIIFQDRNDIKWGQYWKDRIEESLDKVTFLIPMITPSFFNSPPCRSELEKFLEREKKLRRKDLILPVYYVDCPLLNDEAKRASDDLAEVVAGRQYADWRHLRFEPFASPEVGKRLAELGVQVREALERTGGPAKRRATGKPSARRSTRAKAAEPSDSPTEGVESVSDVAKLTRGPTTKTEPPTLVVDPMHRGDHTTINAAIEDASPGGRILIRPGLYEEALVIEKPLEIIGVGERDEIVIQATGANALWFKTTMGRAANLTIRQMGDGNWFCVDIAQGRLELDGCDITSESLTCVAIHGGADPRLRRNRIHDGKQSGVVVYENSLGVLEDNDIFGNALSGVSMREGSNPTLRRNRIHDGKQSGVLVSENSLPLLEDNDIFGNRHSELAIRDGGNPTVRRNRIHDGKGGGVHIYKNGLGVLEENDIFGNALSEVSIGIGGNPTFRRNRIHGSKRHGVMVYDNGLGVLEDNDIFGNALSGVKIRDGANPTVDRCRINNNAYVAVWVSDGGAGTIEDNDLRDNARGAWDISEDSESNVTRARNLE